MVEADWDPFMLVLQNCDGLASNPGGTKILLLVSCYRNQDNLQPNGPFVIKDVSVVVDRWCKTGKIIFTNLSQWSHFEMLIVDFDSYTASLHLAMRSIVCVTMWSTLVHCYWYISFLIIIPTLWQCSLISPNSNWPPVVLFDSRYPCFENVYSTIFIDVIWMTSYMDSFLDPLCVRVTINKLELLPNG